jgi:hypothetical protein
MLDAAEEKANRDGKQEAKPTSYSIHEFVSRLAAPGNRQGGDTITRAPSGY